MTLTHLRKTALPETRVELALRNALESEAELMETEGADERLLTLLGLRGNQSAQTKRGNLPSPTPSNQSQPGTRSPGRDSIGQEEQPGLPISTEEQAAG